MQTCEPRPNILIPPPLDALDVECNVVSFCFESMLSSLLHDRELNQNKNLLVDIHDPFVQKPSTEAKLCDDVLDGHWFKRTLLQKAGPNPDGSKFVCPLILTLDETCISTHAKLQAHALMFTLGIFNKETRNKHTAWRPLAFLPNYQGLLSSSQKKKLTGEQNPKFIFISYNVLFGIS